MRVRMKVGIGAGEVALAVMAGVAAVALMAVQPPTPAPVRAPTPTPVRPYFPVAPSAMARNLHTHVETTGWVVLSKHERDGDWHLRIADGVGFVVAECIPELPCPHPRRGQCVRVRGISRIDGEHKWPEVHPVEHLEVVPCPR